MKNINNTCEEITQANTSKTKICINDIFHQDTDDLISSINYIVSHSIYLI